MSIASEISRLQTAKADLKTAIEGKGVTVPSAATLDDYGALVSSISGGSLQPTKSVSYTPSETAISASVTPDSGYDAIQQVNISVDAVSSSYVGSGVTRRSSSDLTASGATVTAPAGYYSLAATKTIPSASQMYGGVAEINANGDVSFDVEIDNGGYVSGGTNRITDSGAVTVRSSSDLTASGATVTAPSGYYLTAATKTIPTITPYLSYGDVNSSGDVNVDLEVDAGGYIAAGTYSLTASGQVPVKSSSDLTVSGATVTAPAGMYPSAASKSVASGSEGTPTTISGLVQNHSISITPTVTNTAGYISGGTKTGTAVSVSASDLVSGSETKTTNGTYDVTNLASVVVAIPVVTYYTGSSAPSSSLGLNGDIYLQG